MSGPVKRSLTVSGHRTSLSMEPEFWAVLKTLAKSRGLTTAALIAEIDAARGSANLSSAARVYALKNAMAAAAAEVPSRSGTGHK
jgi:predicted DNA-binding ribbon-helix-helix protein